MTSTITYAIETSDSDALIWQAVDVDAVESYEGDAKTAAEEIAENYLTDAANSDDFPTVRVTVRKHDTTERLIAWLDEDNGTMKTVQP